MFNYKEYIREKIIDYKFNEKPYYYKTFSKIFITNKKMCDILKSYDIIIPVPIHNKRRKQRGYNQTELISKEISKEFANLNYKNILIKNKNAKPQSTLNKEQRIENDYIRQEKIIPYMAIRHRHFTTKDRIRIKYRPKGIVALYYYYRYLIKLYTRNNTQYKLTPKMREEVKKMDEYSKKIRFLCKYKIETMSDVDNVKEKKQKEMQNILNTRNRLYYKRQKLDNESEKDSVTKEIINVTSILQKVRKEIRLCDDIYDSVPRMKKQIKEVDEKENENAKEKKLKEKKKKVRRYER